MQDTVKIEDTKHLSNLLSLTIITFPFHLFHPCDQPLIEEREVRNDQVLGTEREIAWLKRCNLPKDIKSKRYNYGMKRQPMEG